jgi:hypothetical protein
MHNQVTSYLNKTVERITPALSLFLNKKLVRADNTLVKRAENLIEWPQGIKTKPLYKGHSVQVSRPYFKIYAHSLSIHVRICFSGPVTISSPGRANIETTYCHYITESSTIATLDHRVLKQITNNTLPTHSPATEERKYNAAVKLRAKLTEAVNNIALYAHREQIRSHR